MTTNDDGKMIEVDIATSEVKPGTIDGFVNGSLRRRESSDLENGLTVSANVIGAPWTSTGIVAGPIARSNEDGSKMNLGMKMAAEIVGNRRINNDVDRFDSVLDCVNSKNASFLDPIATQQAIAIVEGVRALVGKDDSLADKTQAAYLRIAIRLERAIGERFDQAGHLGWQEILDSVARQPKTFRLYKAAICWYLRKGVRRALEEQEKIQRSGQRGDSWQHKVVALKELGEEYRQIKFHTRNPQEFTEGMRVAENKSKRLDLPVIQKKYGDWNVRMLHGSLEGRYADVVRAMDLVGARPDEFVKGVVVAAESNGEASVTIRGSKVDGVRGQPWRKISFPLVDLPIEWQVRLHNCGQFVVAIESTEALRSALHRISGRVLPHVPFATAYVFRHAFATRLRRQGFSAQEIGAFMGHTASETQKAYGFKGASIKGGKKLRTAASIRITVPRTVRPIDSSGLNIVVAKRGIAKQRFTRP